MAEPTPLQSLAEMARVIENVPCTGPERDALRFHAENVRRALQPKESPENVPPPDNGRSAE